MATRQGLYSTTPVSINPFGGFPNASGQLTGDTNTTSTYGGDGGNSAEATGDTGSTSYAGGETTGDSNGRLGAQRGVAPTSANGVPQTNGLGAPAAAAQQSSPLSYGGYVNGIPGNMTNGLGAAPNVGQTVSEAQGAPVSTPMNGFTGFGPNIGTMSQPSVAESYGMAAPGVAPSNFGFGPEGMNTSAAAANPSPTTNGLGSLTGGVTAGPAVSAPAAAPSAAPAATNSATPYASGSLAGAGFASPSAVAPSNPYGGVAPSTPFSAGSFENSLGAGVDSSASATPGTAVDGYGGKFSNQVGTDSGIGSVNEGTSMSGAPAESGTGQIGNTAAQSQDAGAGGTGAPSDDGGGAASHGNGSDD